VILATQESEQEDFSSKPAQANSSKTLSRKKPLQERAGGVAQDVGPEIKPQHCQKKKKKIKHRKNF
jgi:hypothetical protein